MLVLSRKAKQEIMIGDNIIVKIIKVRGSKIKIGIEAPNNVAIVRTEVEDDDKTIDCCLHKNIVNEVE